jgi:hypothetical protein
MHVCSRGLPQNLLFSRKLAFDQSIQLASVYIVVLYNLLISQRAGLCTFHWNDYSRYLNECDPYLGGRDRETVLCPGSQVTVMSGWRLIPFMPQNDEDHVRSCREILFGMPVIPPTAR